MTPLTRQSLSIFIIVRSDEAIWEWRHSSAFPLSEKAGWKPWEDTRGKPHSAEESGLESPVGFVAGQGEMDVLAGHCGHHHRRVRPGWEECRPMGELNSLGE